MPLNIKKDCEISVAPIRVKSEIQSALKAESPNATEKAFHAKKSKVQQARLRCKPMLRLMSILLSQHPRMLITQIF